MRHEAFQYEFPLHQGEFPFVESPAIFGISGVLGAFSWWAVLLVQTFEFADVEPFHNDDLVSSFGEIVFELWDYLREFEVDLGHPGIVRKSMCNWLDEVASAYEFRSAYNFLPCGEWIYVDVRSLLFEVRNYHAVSEVMI